VNALLIFTPLARIDPARAPNQTSMPTLPTLRGLAAFLTLASLVAAQTAPTATAPRRPADEATVTLSEFAVKSDPDRATRPPRRSPAVA
jgi:hypothetical protein